MSHTLIWRSDDGPPTGAAGLLGWQKYSLDANPFHFFRCGEGQIGTLASDAVRCAVERGCDVTVAWGAAPDFRATPAHQLEETFRKLRPATLVCPERPKSSRWVICEIGTPASLPEAAVQSAVNDVVALHYPLWRHGIEFTARCLMLRHGVDAQSLGLVEPLKPTPDDILNMLAADPEVRGLLKRMAVAWTDLAEQAEKESPQSIVQQQRQPQSKGLDFDVLTPEQQRLALDG